MPVAGYNHQDEYDHHLGIQIAKDRPLATIYIGQGCMTTEIELTLDELRAFGEQINKALHELGEKEEDLFHQITE